MFKSVKKLKFWPRKKRKKKTHHQPYYPPPPPQRPAPPPPRHCYCSCSSSLSSIQPSAPPLPPWMVAEYIHDHETPLAPQLKPAPEFAYQPHHPVPSQQHESALNTNASSSTSTSTSTSTSPFYPYPTSSYQQYTVPDPVYGVPVAEAQTETQSQTHTARATTRGRSAAAATIFGCVVDLGIRLFRCLCPCFHIREVILH